MNYRNDKLLALAHSIGCQARIPGTCEGGEGEPAHSNQYRHGKGKSLKAHDCFFASMCRRCHYEIDQGTRLHREERRAIWQDAYDRTMLELWKRGYLMVRGDDRDHDTVPTAAVGPAAEDALRPTD